MNALARRVTRWLKSTSNRTFVAWPLLLLSLQAWSDHGWPELNLWGLSLLAWGYGQYYWVGRIRLRDGGGGPGLSNPPQRLVTTGLYAWSRNPMYLGHIIFFAGLAVLLSPAVWLVFAAHVYWFNQRASRDEAHLMELFGQPYRDYAGRVKRWIPGVF